MGFLAEIFRSTFGPFQSQEAPKELGPILWGPFRRKTELPVRYAATTSTFSPGDPTARTTPSGGRHGPDLVKRITR